MILKRMFILIALKFLYTVDAFEACHLFCCALLVVIWFQKTQKLGNIPKRSIRVPHL